MKEKTGIRGGRSAKSHTLELQPMTAEEIAKIFDFSQHRLRQLERQGVFEKDGHDRYDPWKVIPAICEHMRESNRRAMPSPQAQRLANAKAESIERKMERDAGGLIELETVDEMAAEFFEICRMEFAEVPRAIADKQIASKAAGLIEGAFSRAERRFATASASALNGDGYRLPEA